MISVTTPSPPVITLTTVLSETTLLSANIPTSLTGLPNSVLSNAKTDSTLTFVSYISEGNRIIFKLKIIKNNIIKMKYKLNQNQLN